MLSIKHQLNSYLYDITSTKGAKRNKLYSRDRSNSIRTSPTTMSLPNRKLILISSLTYINDLNRKQAISILTLMHAIVFSNQAKLHVGCTALHRGADHLGSRQSVVPEQRHLDY